MQTHYLTLQHSAEYRMAYHQWGDADNPRVLVCVHGLARNGRDFDFIAEQLSSEYRVICPDVVGRGVSDWLPENLAYDMPLYVADMQALLQHLQLTQVDWLGTSMGGIIGMLLASLPESPIQRLVLNDVGCRIPAAALQRIAMYVGDHGFESLAEIEAYMRKTYRAYHDLEDRQWQHLARYGHRRDQSGRLHLHYDPRIAGGLATTQYEDIDLMPYWSQVTCPQLLIWGEESDLLEAATVTIMQAANPQLDVLKIAATSHAPALMMPAQMQPVCDWLLNR